ncbi:hypothetical protein QBC34DRAFT_399169 [Podospora aff. communis PSN243]|uniref:Preprotein translocase subunit YajC n=1 Tax=Podospora aff. communis PSN243 TaxID=3040156 RepID=A0AAV9GUT6_9PEZI|nr:hypothetical protein QBC34DRAFT_399169 [Podospora aff. communis PSN243]
MAWGKSKSAPAPAPSTIGQILPLLVTLIFVGGLAFVLYQIYDSLLKIKSQAKKQMGTKNVVFTKDGVRVGVKHVETEAYVDRTQSWVIKAWNLSGNEVKDKSKRKS